jgi:hypothetical protein
LILSLTLDASLIWDFNKEPIPLNSVGRP